MTRPNEYTAQQRAALVAYLLAQGDSLTTNDIATRTGVTRQAAYAIVVNLSAVMPIYRGDDGAWRVDGPVAV